MKKPEGAVSGRFSLRFSSPHGTCRSDRRPRHKLPDARCYFLADLQDEEKSKSTLERKRAREAVELVAQGGLRVVKNG